MNCFHLLLFLFAATVVQAQDIFSWVDDKGVRHFSDTSPTNEMNTDVSVESQMHSVFSEHHLYRIKEGYGYCGSLRLPADSEEEPREKLINLLFAKKSLVLRKQNLEQDLHDFHKRESNDKRTATNFARIEETIEECDCTLNWIEGKLRKLEKVKDQIVMEARQAEYNYANAQKECGPEPVAENQADPEVVGWTKCTMNNVNHNNQLLKEKKEALGREQMLIRSMQ